jgi:hypothetical protein
LTLARLIGTLPTDLSPVLAGVGDFATQGWTMAYEKSCFFSLVHLALTWLQRSAEPIAANRVPGDRHPIFQAPKQLGQVPRGPLALEKQPIARN